MCEEVGIECNTESITEIDLNNASDEELAADLMKSMTTNGFAYLRSTQLYNPTDNYAQKARRFFTQSNEYKSRYSLPSGSYSGWMTTGKESLNPKRPADYRESFNIEVPFLPSLNVAPELVKQEIADLTKQFVEVSTKILRLLGIGLNLKDPDYLVKVHHFNSEENLTAMRINYYPALITEETTDNLHLMANQVRCGEHSDYGTVTLLYTDSPGLEVLNRSTGKYMQLANTGGIYVNLGDMLQMWSDDVLIANKHRVMIPTERKYLTSDRISIAFFCQPDKETIIQSLTGAGKYPPIKAADWLNDKFTTAQKY